MIRFFILALIFTNITLLGQSLNEIKIGNRLQITSEYMDEEREFQVYLPPTYFFSDKNNYPVIYLMDGDYNFQYVTGLIELMSNVSGKMPECIVVGISDKGSSKYRANCTPDQIKEWNGNAGNYMEFIDKELKPYINSNYKTAGYDIIIGHSIGGLFVTNFLIEKPSSFKAFIAIDPALWLGDFEIISRADSILRTRKELASTYYISSSSAKGMGINKFVKTLKKRISDKHSWEYFKLEEENHNSVGLPTIKNSFEAIFDGWSVSEKEFFSFKNSSEVLNHFTELTKRFPSFVTIHPYFMGNIMYYYFEYDKKEDLLNLENGIKEHFPGSIEEFYNQLALKHLKNEDYESAIIYFNKSIATNAASFNAYDGLSKVFLSQKKYEAALTASEKSISIAVTVNARQWMMNQLNANLENIKFESSKNKNND